MCTFLHMDALLMFMWRVSISATLTPAGDTWPCRPGLCCERLYGLAERGDPLCGSPRRRGASCTSLFAPFGPLCPWPPCSDPLGSTKCSWTSALPTSWWREKTTLRSSFLSLYLSPFNNQIELSHISSDVVHLFDRIDRNTLIANI